MIDSFGILDKKGKSMILRDYSDLVLANYIEDFQKHLLNFDSDRSPPIYQLENGNCLFWTLNENVLLLGASKIENNSITMFSFLDSFKSLLVESFGKFDAESVKENIILIYELLDEVIDGGMLMQTDFSVLKKYIMSSANIFNNPKKRAIGKEREIAKGLSSKIPWRAGTFKYSKNEVYLDVIEKVNMTMTTGNKVIRSTVEGKLKMKCYLSGTPELLLGLNDKRLLSVETARSVDMQDINFHQCVRLARFEDDRTISFIPPDGEFDLISYRMDCPYKGLFSFDYNYEQISERRFELIFKVQTNYKQKVVANFVEFLIPISQNCTGLESVMSCGEGKTAPEESAYSWKVHAVAGKKDLCLRLSFDVGVDCKQYAFKTQPIRVHFEIPFYTLSGVLVKFLKIKDRSDYKALSWVRYLAKNGECLIRLAK